MKSSNVSALATYATLFFFFTSPQSGCGDATSPSGGVGCGETSVATPEGDVTDPSKLVVTTQIKRATRYPDIFEVSLLDDKGHQEISNAKVMLQDVTLVFRATAYELPSQSDLRIVTDSTYTVTIALSDQDKFVCSVHTQEKELSYIGIPPSCSLDTALTITWGTPDSRYPMYVALRSYSRMDSTQYTNNGDITLNIPDPGSGSYTIPTSYFTDHPGMYYLSIGLYSERVGTTDPRLNPSSKISSIMLVGAVINK